MVSGADGQPQPLQFQGLSSTEDVSAPPSSPAATQASGVMKGDVPLTLDGTFKEYSSMPLVGGRERADDGLEGTFPDLAELWDSPATPASDKKDDAVPAQKKDSTATDQTQAPSQAPRMRKATPPLPSKVKAVSPENIEKKQAEIQQKRDERSKKMPPP